MAFSGSIISTSFTQALGELRANRLRTVLSLLGITIGIFCIVAVAAVLNSMEAKIHENMSALGSDVLYINRRPWMPEGGEYKWWEYLQRRPMSLADMRVLQRNVPEAAVVTICYVQPGATVKADGQSVEGAMLYAAMPGFEKVQNVEVQQGRYLSAAELETGSNTVVIGHEIKESLFGNLDAIGRTLKIAGRSFHVGGVMHKEGQNMAGFNFDNSIILSYATASSMYDIHSRDWNNDPTVMVKARPGVSVDELEDEVMGVLRAERKVRPGAAADFSVNRLSEVSKRLSEVFGVVNMIGGVIGLFSLLVGAFGIANIMFVTVRERTKVIGLKKAIGARRIVIMTEFLVEAVTLCLIGGAVGILLVWLLGLGLTYALDFPISLSVSNIVFGVGISALVGIVAGLAPALSASRLNPVVAIRST